ncbi:MAG: 2-amino-4-hydroxy-6-hydroxymethyldihydropteridine diphosphokinase [Chlorobi bacterium]|nr:2-amino-4-hydroxy-6-hydroxymethyldihydropteridine diphosphokinase [Chlorobiota bacterium]
MSIVYLSLGSNKENRLNYLKFAIEHINSELGDIIAISDIWESESWNYSDNDYLNLTIKLKSELTPQEILKKTQNIEKKLGRTNKTKFINGKAKYSSRTIDIDILFYDNEIINSKNLIIPHPNLHLRMFVLKPLLQITSEFVHPIFKKNIKQLIKECKDDGKIEIFKENFQKELLFNLQNSKK